jgi:uncharacterized protein YndB with AHSA1/START domain
MATPQKGVEATLEICRTFKALRAKVFAAWTEREKLVQWMCRDVPTHDPKYLELDLRPGGRYAIEIKLPDGMVYLGRGVFREVKPPEKLVFTWAWKRAPEDKKQDPQTGDPLVTVEFIERGASTEMVFKHAKLSSRESYESHKKGWEGCFEKLEEHLGA